MVRDSPLKHWESYSMVVSFGPTAWRPQGSTLAVPPQGDTLNGVPPSQKVFPRAPGMKLTRFKSYVVG